MDKLKSLMIFMRSTQSGSFSKAARQLGMAPSAVSRAVLRLEEKNELIKRSRRLQICSRNLENWYNVFLSGGYKCTSIQLYYQTLQQIEVTKKTGKLTIQLDEMWTSVGSKNNKEWIWLAIDADTREIVGVHVGDRSRQSAKKLCQSLPPVYRGA